LEIVPLLAAGGEREGEDEAEERTRAAATDAASATVAVD